MKGLSWPLSFADNGRLNTKEESYKIRQNGETILNTLLRERLYEPNQGTENYLALLQNFDESNASALVSIFTSALNEQEPRATWSVSFVSSDFGGNVIFNIKFIRKDKPSVESFDKNVAEFVNA